MEELTKERNEALNNESSIYNYLFQYFLIFSLFLYVLIQ